MDGIIYKELWQLFDEETKRKIEKDSLDCAKETIRISKEKGYLKDYFADNEEEAIHTLRLKFINDLLKEMYEEAMRP